MSDSVLMLGPAGHPLTRYQVEGHCLTSVSLESVMPDGIVLSFRCELVRSSGSEFNLKFHVEHSMHRIGPMWGTPSAEQARDSLCAP